MSALRLSLLLCLAAHAHGCAVALASQLTGDFDFVCDTTVPWLRHDGTSWAPATPPAGTGCHEYVAMKGAPPAGCTVGAACAACAAPPGSRTMAVSLEGGTCEPCGSLRHEWELAAASREEPEEA